jgi:hypothetical protein
MTITDKILEVFHELLGMRHYSVPPNKHRILSIQVAGQGIILNYLISAKLLKMSFYSKELLLI